MHTAVPSSFKNYHYDKNTKTISFSNIYENNYVHLYLNNLKKLFNLSNNPCFLKIKFKGKGLLQVFSHDFCYLIFESAHFYQVNTSEASSDANTRRADQYSVESRQDEATRTARSKLWVTPVGTHEI